jgi:hypothetical protein
MQQHVALDEFARLELGFRIFSTPESYRELEKILGKDQKVAWARTPTHRHGKNVFAIPAELDEDERVWIPDNVVDAFTRYKGFLMVKLVTPLPRDHYANLAMYDSNTGRGKLWGFDHVQPQRDNGDWVYSMPIHGLEKAGEGRRFFFVIRLDHVDTVDGDRIVLTVNRVDISRGKEHFTFGPTRKFGPFPPTSRENVVGLARMWETQQGRESHKFLADLPLEQALAEYVARRS